MVEIGRPPIREWAGALLTRPLPDHERGDAMKVDDQLAKALQDVIGDGVPLDRFAALLELLSARDAKWKALYFAEQTYQAVTHRPVSGRYGAQRRDREVESARTARDRLAKELGV